MDLGASSLRTLRSVLLPLLSPAIVASAIVVFALSMDDFVVSAFLSAGSGTDTVPVRIYSNARGSPTPALNALASLTLFLTLGAVALAFGIWEAVRRRGGERGSAVRELARLELCASTRAGSGATAAPRRRAARRSASRRASRRSRRA